MQILASYTADEGSPVLSSIITAETDLSEMERAKMRLARVGGSGGNATAARRDARETALQASQVELMCVIEQMNADILRFWHGGDKVRSLRISIQASKLLGHNKVPKAYPSVFSLVSTVLDTFGDLVADRILQTAAQRSSTVAALVNSGRGCDIPAVLLPQQAVEMCHNWFLKILSIRELLPRIYIELSLLQSYAYVEQKAHVDIASVVQRLGMQLRGVADPLVSVHARWYLFLRAEKVLGSRQAARLATRAATTAALAHGGGGPPRARASTATATRNSGKTTSWATALVPCFLDALDCVAYESVNRCGRLGLSLETYVWLFVPALSWMTETLLRHGPAEGDVMRLILDKLSGTANDPVAPRGAPAASA